MEAQYFLVYDNDMGEWVVDHEIAQGEDIYRTVHETQQAADNQQWRVATESEMLADDDLSEALEAYESR